MSYKPAYANKSVYPKGDSVNVRELPGTVSKIVQKVLSGVNVGRSSGNYGVMPDGEWLQVNLATPVNGRKYGYVRADVVKLLEPQASPVADKNGDKLLQDLVKSDLEVYQRIFNIYRAIHYLKKKGKDVSKVENVAKQIIARLAKRQVKLMNTAGVDVKKVVETPFKVNYVGISGEEISAPQLVVVAVVALVTLAAAAAIYYAFKPDYEDSKIDFKLSSELDAKLKQVLTADEYTQLTKEGQQQIEDAYNEGKNDQKWDDFGGIVKVALWGTLGFIGITKLVDVVNASRKGK